MASVTPLMQREVVWHEAPDRAALGQAPVTQKTLLGS